MFDLQGKKGLVVGIANDKSIAYGCAKAFRQCGAELALTYLNDKAKPHVEPLARELDAALLLPLDVEQDGQLEAVFAAVAERFGKLDFLVHAIDVKSAEGLPGEMERKIADTFGE